MYWKFLERISLGSPGLLFALIFLSFAIPAILLVHAIEWLGGK